MASEIYTERLKLAAANLAIVLGVAACNADERSPSSQATAPIPAPRAAESGTLALVPARAAITTQQKQSFRATAGRQVLSDLSWDVDGIPGGSADVGTVDSGGRYTPPNAGGTHVVTVRRGPDASEKVSATVAVTDLAGVFTGRYDRERTGQNRKEYALTPETVSVEKFGKLFACPVDGEIYAQPLYVANLPIAGGTHNVVFVATQHNSVYAFDADEVPCRIYWHKSFLKQTFLNLFPGAAGTVPIEDTRNAGRNIEPEVGITGTPVIDPSTNTLYLVVRTKERITVYDRVHDAVVRQKDKRRFAQRLHALNLADGVEKYNGPADISNAITVPGTGDRGDDTCPSPNGEVPFCPRTQNQRPPLLLVAGRVYIAWASHGDHGPYHGWVIGYNASNLGESPVVFNATPNGSFGGFWGGLAADDGDNIFVVSGNGTFDVKPPRSNYGNSFIKLSTSGGSLSLADFFTPFNQEEIDIPDWDLGSGGPLVLPEAVGSDAHPRLVVAGDKSGQLYLVDRDNMGGYCDGCTSNKNIVQQVALQGVEPPCVVCGIFTTPAVWEGHLYVSAVRDALKSYEVHSARISATPLSASSHKFEFPGGAPAVSSNGAANGIVWVIDASLHGTPKGQVWIDGKPTSPFERGPKGPAVLYAYDARDLSKELWNSSQAPDHRDRAGHAVKFAVPTVANGKVYVGTQNALTVFGLLPY